MIKVEGFHKAYEKTLAVRGVSFEVAAGQILGLVGPNGAGKTTTLRALAGIIPSSRGQLSVAGHSLDGDAVQAKLRLAYVPDDPQLFRDLTVDQHLAFTASAYHVADPDAKAADLLEIFELADRRTTPAGNLSRGMRQKLAICCAYLHAPSAVLLDEPLTGLDPHGIRTLKRSIVERAERGAAFIISSHLLAMVEDICTHVLILESGRQRFCGRLTDFKASFATQQDEPSLEELYFLATGVERQPEAANC